MQNALILMLGPLLGLFIVSIGNGFISSLTALRLDSAGVSDTFIGLVSSSYFIGLTLGAVFNDRLITRIGHIRAYSSFASLTAATFLLQGLFFSPWAWFFFRLVNGWAIIGIFIVVESWLLLGSDQKTRGRILAIYMIVFYGSGVLSQMKLGAINDWGESAPFMFAGILGSLSVLPMVILPRISPEVSRVEPLMPHDLLRLSPAGLIGCFGSGITIAAVYTLLPIYLQRTGMNITQVGQLMGCVIFGAMALQYPVGRWSDKQDRQMVLLVLSVFCAVLSLLILILPSNVILLSVLLFLLGGGIFAVYPVAVSHSADRAATNELVRMIQGLLLINSIGSVISPLIISPTMAKIGNSGFFWIFMLINLLMAGFFLLRRRMHPAPTSVTPFEPTTQMSPTGAEMRMTDKLVNATKERDDTDN